MRNIKGIASLLLMFSLVLIPVYWVDAAQPPLYVDFTNTYDGTTKSIKIDNGIHLMDGGDFFREVKIDVKYLPENAKVYFGYINGSKEKLNVYFGGELVSNEVQYMSDIPSENNSECIKIPDHHYYRILIKVVIDDEEYYYSLADKVYFWDYPERTPIDYKTIPDGYEFHIYAGYNSYALEPYGDLNLKIDYVSDEEEKQQRFGSFIDKYVGAEDSVNFFDFSLCDSEGNTVDVPEEYQLPSIYRIDFKSSHYNIGGGPKPDFPNRRDFGNEAKVYDITDYGSNLLAAIDGEGYMDLEALEFKHMPSGTVAVVDSGPQRPKHLYHEWVDDTHIKVSPVDFGVDGVLFMASYDRGGRYLSSTEPIAVPAYLNTYQSIPDFNGYEFDVRQEPNAKKVRFFLWDSVESMEPICDSVEIELE